MNKSDLRKALAIYSSGNLDADPLAVVKKINYCREVTDLFLDGLLPMQDYLDRLESQGLDMDKHEKTVSENFHTLGIV